MSRCLSSRGLPLGLLLGAAVLAGCASTPKMVPRDDPLVFASTGRTLGVGHVEGGQESDALLAGSRIDGWTVRLAFREALLRSNLFTEMRDAGDADDVLTTHVLVQHQPALTSR